MFRFSFGVAVVAAAAMAASSSLAVATQEEGSYQFALWGDLPYTKPDPPTLPVPPPSEDAELMAFVDEMNAADLKFTVFLGDIKSGSTLCTDEKYTNFKELTDLVEPPTVISLGDNGWTDCHRDSNGQYDPLERLDLMRSTYYSEEGLSTGKNPMEVEMQSAEYPENQRWGMGPAYFISAHVVGSNNNKVNEGECQSSSSVNRTQEACDAANHEYEARTTAVLTWLNESFAEAEEQGYAGVMVLIQANMDLDYALSYDINEAARTSGNDGFTEIIETLYNLAHDYPGAVVLAHGDSHQFIYDKPFPAESATFSEDPEFAYFITGEQMDNFFRVEVPGAKNLDWVLVTVNPSYRHIFEIKPMFDAP